MGKLSKWKCKSCDWKGLDNELLTAESPFRADDVLIACPNCRLTEGFDEACDIEGCWENASCGTPVKDGFATFSGDDSRDGYLRTCYKHLPKERQNNK